jgi:hypothetical protein
MKALAGSLLLWGAYLVPLAGQERDRSLERIAFALQQPHTMIRSMDPIETAGPRTFGIFTFVRPELPGEFVRISVPIGELVSRAFKGISEAKQRRQEETARRRVEADLKWFAAQHPPAKP